MEIQIDNLKAKMRGVELNSYQKGLALDEFEKLIAHTEALEHKLRQYNVVGRSEQLTCPRCKSTNILNPDRDNDAQCIECAFIWAG